MAPWLLATLAGLAAAGVQYGAHALRPGVAPLALLRALVVAIVVAMLLGAPGGRSTPLAPEIALDASESWTRGGAACDRWGAALDSARRAGSGTRLRFGDSTRADDSRAGPGGQGNWGAVVFDIPPGALQPGANTLSITNLDPSDKVNYPIFFMLDYAQIVWGEGGD